MKRIQSTFDRLRESGRTGLVPYVTAGDPDVAGTREILDAVVRGGADVVELGVPFSDPMADGPVIQAAMTRALAGGMRYDDVLEIVRGFRARHPDVPMVLFGYFNPLLQRGLGRACVEAAQAGADGLLIVDLPAEEAAELTAHTRPAGLEFIGLFTPTTDPERVRKVGEHAGGFAYCVSRTGVTGAQVTDLSPVEDRVAEIRQATGLPVAVGFGIRTPDDAARVASFADAVVVGSALVDAMARANPVEAPVVAEELMRGLRAGIDAADAAR